MVVDLATTAAALHIYSKEPPVETPNVVLSDRQRSHQGQRTRAEEMAFGVLILMQIAALAVASTGTSLTKETDILTSLVSPLAFFILKLAKVIAIQQ